MNANAGPRDAAPVEPGNEADSDPSEPNGNRADLPWDDHRPQNSRPRRRPPVPEPPRQLPPVPDQPVVRTGSTDRHLASDEPVIPQPISRPRSYRDLDEIPDDFE